MSDFNLNENELKKLMKNASSSSSIDIGKMKEAADSGKLDDFLNKNLSPDTGKKLRSVLSDKKALEKMLGSKEAQALLQKFKKE